MPDCQTRERIGEACAAVDVLVPTAPSRSLGQ
jgi:hypothetical protein